MKQTQERNLYYRANAPPATGAINGPDWQAVPPPVVVQAPKRNGSSFPWGILIVVLGLMWLVSSFLKTPQERPAPSQVQSTRIVPRNAPAPRVERALPILRGVPRAEAVPSANVAIDQYWLSDPANIGKWMAMFIPGEGSVWVRYQGEIPYVSSLPLSAQRWDWYHVTGSHDWIWMQSAATGRLGWLDP